MTGRGRLAASVEASSLIRRAESEGGFGTVLRKGDPDRGALLLVVRKRDQHFAFLERTLAMDGRYRWERVGPGEDSQPGDVADFLAGRLRFDPDQWLIELDIAQPERFIAETTVEG